MSRLLTAAFRHWVKEMPCRRILQLAKSSRKVLHSLCRSHSIHLLKPNNRQFLLLPILDFCLSHQDLQSFAIMTHFPCYLQVRGSANGFPEVRNPFHSRNPVVPFQHPSCLSFRQPQLPEFHLQPQQTSHPRRLLAQGKFQIFCINVMICRIQTIVQETGLLKLNQSWRMNSDPIFCFIKSRFSNLLPAEKPMKRCCFNNNITPCAPK